jgi:predicted NACHT family NTPase
MANRSLKASAEGIKKARKAYNAEGLTQEALAEQVNLKTRQPVSKFFAGKPIDRHVFIEICTALDLNWEDIKQQEAENSISETATPSTIADTVQAVRKQIRPLVKERCGTMRVLDMTQPIELAGNQGIYTDVNILEKITGRRRLKIAELLVNAGLEGFERFGLSSVEKRVPGLEAVKQDKKLIVLGKPGAGKTTFLKFLAISCIEGDFLNNLVPVFITLKDFAEAKKQPSLMKFIQQLLSLSETQDLIQQGRGLILLDGLDEVREEDIQRVIRQIQNFSNRYSANQFVITCRIAAKEYTFEKFTEVEVADFSKEQITIFVHKWFKRKEPDEAEVAINKFLDKLRESERIRELATNPLLLTLLCLEFEESFDFPESRADLYERGLKVLLSKWDASRKIERSQIYKRLSLKRKEDLLSHLALRTFTEKNYFLKQRTIEAYIMDYIANLPDAKDDPDALLLDSEAVLKSIEAQHGLLIERAKGIYSFSHLTFQEYFAARQIKEQRSDTLLEDLVGNVIKKRWREVFRLTVEMLPDANSLLLMMKAKIDQIMLKDSELQRLLDWVYKKSQSVEVEANRTAVRALYVAPLAPHSVRRQLDLFASLSKLSTNRSSNISVHHSYLYEKHQHEIDRGLDYIFGRIRDLDC